MVIADKATQEPSLSCAVYIVFYGAQRLVQVRHAKRSVSPTGVRAHHPPGVNFRPRKSLQVSPGVRPIPALRPGCKRIFGLTGPVKSKRGRHLTRVV